MNRAIKKALSTGRRNGASESEGQACNTDQATPTADTLRNLRDAPWCWQHKALLKYITEIFSESNQAVSARSLYLALTELASDEHSESFKATKALIAHKAGISISTVARLLRAFEGVGIVRIDRESTSANSGVIKAANTYSLLAMSRDDLSTTGHGLKQTCMTDKVEESKKILEETFEETRSDDRSRSAHDAPRTPSVPHGFDEQEQAVISLYHEIVMPSGSHWFPVNQFTQRVRDAIADWLADFRESTIEDLEGLFLAVSEGDERVTIPKRRTLVRLLRENPPDSLWLEGNPVGVLDDDPTDDFPF